MKATKWIRYPGESFIKAFDLVGGFRAPDGFLLDGHGKLLYSYLPEEVNPRFLESHLGDLGYVRQTMDGQEEVRLVYQGETPFVRNKTFRGPRGERVGIFERQKRRRDVVVFYENSSST